MNHAFKFILQITVIFHINLQSSISSISKLLRYRTCDLNRDAVNESLPLEFEPKFKFYYHPDANTVGKLAELDAMGYRYVGRKLGPDYRNPGKILYIYYEESVDGLGVRAILDLYQSEYLCVYSGEVITPEEEDKRIEFGEYIMVIDDNSSIDAYRIGNECRFVNHWCSGYNAAVYGPTGEAVLTAIRDIHAGEIISFNYNGEPSTPLDERYSYILKCKCPSAKHVIGDDAVMSIE